MLLIEPAPRTDDADSFAQWRDGQTKAFGYEPNYAGLFASRPDVAEAWTRLNLAVRGGMDRRRFELVTIAAARARASTYCLAAHSKFLRDVCSDEPSMLALTSDPSGAALDPVDHALVVFAAKAATAPASIGETDVAVLRDQGLSDEDIADVVFAVAARCFFATVLDAGGAQADAELAASFEPGTRADLTVGRPFAEVEVP